MRDDRSSHSSNTDVPVTQMATQQSTSGRLGRGQGVNTPSWMSNRRLSSLPKHNTAPENRNLCILPILVGVNNNSVEGNTTMPINIDNNLPCVDFALGQESGGNSIHLRMLVDSGAAMNSGNKAYHRQIVSQFPDIVTEYIECGPGTKYDLVQLKVAVTQSAAEADFTNGTLSAIIRYKTPYFVNSQQLILSFDLGDNLALRTTLIAMHGILDMVTNTLTLQKLDMKLPLVMTEPCSGLVAPSDIASQSGVTTSSPHNSVALHTLSNSSNTKFLTHPSHSDHLVVTDSWDNNTFSRSVSCSHNT